MSEMDIRGDERPSEDGERPIEAPEADTAEQRRPAREEGEEPERPGGEESSPDVDPGDAFAQERPVPLDDEDYR
jgi:hypothetical protein